MDAILQQLLAFPPHPPPATPLSDAEYDKQINIHVLQLNHIPASKLTAPVPGGGDLLDIIDPSVNTVSYLYVLLAQINNSSGKQKADSTSDSYKPGTPLWLKMMLFLGDFDPVQIRYVGNELRNLIEKTALKARLVSMPFSPVPDIRSAILRVDPSGATFTSSHLLFVRLCLEGCTYHDALPVIEKNIYYFPANTSKAAQNNRSPYLCSDHESSSTFITQESGLSAKLFYQDILQYYLFGAMIYMGMRNWKRALFFLEVVIAWPVATNASKIQVEAYKKWVLVSLLHKGHPLTVPKTINSQALKQYRALAKAYDALAEIFNAGITGGHDQQRLVQEAQMGMAFWDSDCNRGLVRLVLEAFRKFSILQLQSTFAALTIADITRKTSPDRNDYAGTGRYVVSLISAGELNASISEPSDDPKSWIIRFSDSTGEPLARSEEQQHEALVKQTRKAEDLACHIRELDRKLSLSKDYIGDAKKRKKEHNGEGADAGVTWPSHGETFDHDEDMMGDL
ncbi:hypothetical protein N7G274_007648 [Stereocaulon virgatum]|uniref:COP9 signalosome complex subunit 3 N-terminal helical repeats domain-containing protein n=1 Tax=Stereocaulon virgatum TaxID=373712 RepID=A0ABR4A2Q8_9LECA